MLQRIFLCLVLLFQCWTVFGQQDSLSVIKPPKRFIEKGDTFSIFTLQSERAIVYNLAQLNDCEKNFNLAKRVIANADTLIFAKNNQIDILVAQRTNLLETASIKDSIITTYKTQTSIDKKTIRKLKLDRIMLSGIIIALTTFTTYIIVK